MQRLGFEARKAWTFLSFLFATVLVAYTTVMIFSGFIFFIQQFKLYEIHIFIITIPSKFKKKIKKRTTGAWNNGGSLVFDGPSGLQSGTSQGRCHFKTDWELLKNIWQSKIENFQLVYHKVATCVKNRYCHDKTIVQTFQSDSEWNPMTI